MRDEQVEQQLNIDKEIYGVCYYIIDKEGSKFRIDPASLVIKKVNEKVNLGKKTFWWKVRVILFSPLWALSFVDPDRKSWQAFKHGLINHKCQYSGKIETIQGIRFQHCSHYGCSMMDDIDLDKI